ncbi:hypothetical protein P167DRAFT_541375 [Morchella conica CCBAS932]|uniref:Uncharacterized protein n=1 Tax=Morchella conica CCBAS932 TaxID=1392247 RepID=A0A3N4L348_9PEZI|nr:hypothetical protein P167DRAFT_541375 [Morchella conica CCBAS932]
MSTFTIDQESSTSNMIHMQSSGMAKTAPPAPWYCPNCGFGPLNPCIDVGCPDCGFTPGRDGKTEQLQCSDQTTPTSFAPTTFTPTPVEVLNVSQTDPKCWMSSELGASQQYSESFLHDSHDGSETLRNFPYFN